MKPKRKTWKGKIGKRLMKHVAESTQRGTLAEVKLNIAHQRANHIRCFECQRIAAKLGIQEVVMKLKRVERNKHNAYKVLCARCSMLGSEYALRREVECYADLEVVGTFYCQECAEALAPNQTDGQLVFACE